MYKKLSGMEKMHREGLLLVSSTTIAMEVSNEISKQLLKEKKKKKALKVLFFHTNLTAGYDDVC